MAIEYVFGSGFVFPLAAEFVSVWKSFILKNAKLNFFSSSFYPKKNFIYEMNIDVDLKLEYVVNLLQCCHV